MKPKFILTVDAEGDRKAVQDSISIHNISRLGEFHEFCLNYRIKPTYLCSYEVIISELFSAFLHKYSDDNYEIGAHLHPWSTPPFTSKDDIRKKPYPTEFSEEVFRAKLESLTKVIKEKCKKPISYRAGRFGFDPFLHTRILLDLGLRIDCSTTPGINWQKTKGFLSGGPDFSDYPSNCYYISEEGKRFTVFLNKGLLEVPVTIFSERSFFNRLRGSKPSITWLRPLPKITRFSKSKIKHLLDKAIKNKVQDVFVMLMHSNELHEEYNTYFNTPSKVKTLFKFLSEFFDYLNKKEIESVTLRDFYLLKKMRKK